MLFERILATLERLGIQPQDITELYANGDTDGFRVSTYDNQTFRIQLAPPPATDDPPRPRRAPGTKKR